MRLNELAGVIASHMAEVTELENEKIDTLRFGMEIILGALIKGIVLFSLAYILGILPHVTIALATAGLFRMVSGGAHCTSYGRCLTFGVLVYLFLGRFSLVVEPFLTLEIVTGLAGCVTFAAILCTIKWAPGEVPYRTMDGQREITMFKILSLFYLILWLGLILYVVSKIDCSISLAAILALVVQTVSFTPWGYGLTASADGLMVKLTNGR